MKKLFSDKLIQTATPPRLLYITLVVVCLTMIILMYVSSQRLFISDDRGLSEEASKVDFCNLAMSQIINKKLSAKLMEEDLYELVRRNSYEQMFLSGSEKIKSIWSDNDKCKIFIKGEGDARVFDFVLTNSGDFPFYFKIKKISEHELYEGGV